MVHAGIAIGAERKLGEFSIFNFQFSIRTCVLILAVATGCASQRSTPTTKSPDPSPAQSTASVEAKRKASTTQPILYQRTGGIAGTNDRVVIWPDGFVQVTGKLLGDGTAMLAPERIAELRKLFRGW